MLTCLLLAAVQIAGGQETAPSPRTWSENYDFQLEMDGKISAGARLFGAAGRPSILVIAEELARPVVLQVDRRQVIPIDPASIAEGPVPSQVTLPDESIAAPPAAFTLDGDSPVFFQEGHRYRIVRKPPLVGPLSFDELLARLPVYRKGMDEYVPAEFDVVYLKGYKQPVSIEVWFGSWCPACKQTVPRFLKGISAAANPNLQVSYTGVPHPPFAAYAPAREKNITGVPTFIVYSEGREIGRISTIPGDSSIEHELVKILYAHAQEKG